MTEHLIMPISFLQCAGREVQTPKLIEVELNLASCSNKAREEKEGRVQTCSVQHADLPCRVSEAPVKGHQQQSKHSCINENQEQEQDPKEEE